MVTVIVWLMFGAIVVALFAWYFYGLFAVRSMSPQELGERLLAKFLEAEGIEANTYGRACVSALVRHAAKTADTFERFGDRNFTSAFNDQLKRIAEFVGAYERGTMNEADHHHPCFGILRKCKPVTQESERK
jgi:hypothetical protein